MHRRECRRDLPPALSAVLVLVLLCKDACPLSLQGRHQTSPSSTEPEGAVQFFRAALLWVEQS
jgi:hypothetical protein